jgi:predicted dehydrogenase
MSGAFSIAPAGLFGKTAPGNQVALGIIGLGGMGSENLERFLGMDGVVVRAVCDAHRGKAEAARARADRHYGKRVCAAVGDYREVCARNDIDAVAVAVPNHLHAAVGIAAALSGKDIYGEPPFTRTLDEGRALLAAVAGSRRVWQTGAHLRGDPAVRRAVAAVRGGAVGRVVRVEVGLPGGGGGPAGMSLAPATVYAHYWRWVSAWGGGMLAEGIGHYGDIALWGAGKDDELPLSVAGHGTYPRDGIFDTATAFRFRCVYRDGVELEVADGGRLEKGVGVRWIGADGAWVWVTRGAQAAGGGTDAGWLRAGEARPAEDLRRMFVEAVKTRGTTLAPAGTAFHAAALGQLGERAMRGAV